MRDERVGRKERKKWTRKGQGQEGRDDHTYASMQVSLSEPPPVARRMDTMVPYRPSASEKMRMSTMGTYMRGCWATARTPASPAIPIDIPAATPLRPTVRPAARSRKLDRRL